LEHEKDVKAKLEREEREEKWLKDQVIERSERRRIEIQKEMEKMKFLEEHEPKEAMQQECKSNVKKKVKKKSTSKKGNQNKK
jgi:hypothetical protein